jgi:hypothetical protein
MNGSLLANKHMYVYDVVMLVMLVDYAQYCLANLSVV